MRRKASKNAGLFFEVKRLSSVDFLVKLRDAATMIADACNEQLEKTKPPEARDTQDFDKLFWETKEGTKGPYQQTSKKATNNNPGFQALQAILKKNKGFCHIGAYRYWFDRDDQDVVDRRKK